MKVQVPFQQLLEVIKELTSAEKARLRQELEDDKLIHNNQDDFIDYLLNGPVYTDKEIEVIKNNRKSITEWRTKS